MTAAARQRIQALSEQLAKPRDDPGMFENIPRIPAVAGDSASQRVKGKVIIVTGVNSPIGIGRASAHQFARNGAKAIFMCDYSTENLETHQRELGQLYPDVKVHPKKIDAGSEDDVKGVVDEALRLYGRLDVFFANAGVVGSSNRIGDASAEDFMQVMRTNALSAFLAAKHASRAMSQTSEGKPYPSGSIIATASVAGLRSNAGGTDYSASKAAVISIMQTTAFQLSGTGIRCNALCPGVIETGMTKMMYDAAKARGTTRKIGQLNPLQRGAIADEVARVALFLGSDEASYVNGQAWAVDGGLSAGHPFVPGKLG
ncbi:putative 3-oxoacyl-reductase FabG [Polychaeton citri CBS 116435]|uniref:3-oxoacyl-reductase FabG n=1 Tax=Polychaeton citri CBS 116435 TaxID=1314669 RepID=A0A9P4Q8V0_9PEZI|nr:putative 3-oxoacyl-reductase FabG [Polychaeton citri CBS 116435]